jgi:hypothetical protein
MLADTLTGNPMTFNTERVDLLKTDPRPLDKEGKLLIAAVQDLARENVPQTGIAANSFFRLK